MIYEGQDPPVHDPRFIGEGQEEVEEELDPCPECGSQKPEDDDGYCPDCGHDYWEEP